MRREQGANLDACRCMKNKREVDRGESNEVWGVQ